jgi:ribosomal protein L35AE/L33A
VVRTGDHTARNDTAEILIGKLFMLYIERNGGVLMWVRITAVHWSWSGPVFE